MPYVTEEWYNNLSCLVDQCDFKMKMMQLALARREKEIEVLRSVVDKTDGEVLDKGTEPNVEGNEEGKISENNVLKVRTLCKPGKSQKGGNLVVNGDSKDKGCVRRRMGRNFMRQSRKNDKKIESWFNKRMVA